MNRTAKTILIALTLISAWPTQAMQKTHMPACHFEGKTEEKLCPICWENIDDLGRPLSCAHLFHADCIEKWLKIVSHCPVCRKSENPPFFTRILAFLSSMPVDLRDLEGQWGSWELA